MLHYLRVNADEAVICISDRKKVLSFSLGEIVSHKYDLHVVPQSSVFGPLFPPPSSFFFPRMVRLLISTELVFIAVKMTAELCISVTAGDLLKIKG